MWVLGLIRLVPWQAWALAAVIGAGVAYHWQATSNAYEAGRTAAILEMEQANARARERAETELRRLDRGDRERVRGFDRD